MCPVFYMYVRSGPRVAPRYAYTRNISRMRSVYQASSFFWEVPGLAPISIYDVRMCGTYKHGYTRIVYMRKCKVFQLLIVCFAVYSLLGIGLL